MADAPQPEMKALTHAIKIARNLTVAAQEIVIAPTVADGIKFCISSLQYNPSSCNYVVCLHNRRKESS